MTSLEMMYLYEELVKKDYISWYKISHKSKRVFRRLKVKLEAEEIDPEDFIRVQFQCKGSRPFPNQLVSKFAIDRYHTYNDLRDAQGLHYQQQVYLDIFLENGYTLEETLAIPIFFYYFRCMLIKDHPKEWDLLAEKEKRNIPSLNELIKEKSNDKV